MLLQNHRMGFKPRHVGQRVGSCCCFLVLVLSSSPLVAILIHGPELVSKSIEGFERMQLNVLVVGPQQQKPFGGSLDTKNGFLGVDELHQNGQGCGALLFLLFVVVIVIVVMEAKVFGCHTESLQKTIGGRNVEFTCIATHQTRNILGKTRNLPQCRDAAIHTVVVLLLLDMLLLLLLMFFGFSLFLLRQLLFLLVLEQRGYLTSLVSPSFQIGALESRTTLG